MEEHSSRNYASFLKVGSRKHMESLINKGIVFTRPIQYYRQIESKNLQGDPHEGSAYIKQINNLELSIGGKVIGIAKKGQIYLTHPEDQGNIFCLYGIETNSLNFELKRLHKFNFNLSGLSFGDTAVFIFEPAEFVLRVEKAAKIKGFDIQCSPVNYFDPEKHEGELSPFWKSSRYADQKEVRLWIPNKLNQDLTFELGNMSDICVLVPVFEIDTLEYQPL
jgi:hypothetical protein